jgi:hypothetical protein
MRAQKAGKVMMMDAISAYFIGLGSGRSFASVVVEKARSGPKVRGAPGAGKSGAFPVPLIEPR